MSVVARRRPCWSVLVGLLLLVSASAARADWTVREERWYVLEISGQWAGHRVDRTETQGERVRTRIDQHLSLSRGTERVAVSINIEWIETRPGEMERMTLRRQLGAEPIVYGWEFEGDQVKETERQEERLRTRIIARPAKGWLTPTEEERFTRERTRANAEAMRYTVLGLDPGLPIVEVTRTRIGEGSFTLGERVLPCSKWVATRSDTPGLDVTMLLSEDHRLTWSEEPFGPMTIVTRLTTREEALGVGREADRVPEMLVSLFVKPDQPIARVERTRRIIYHVRRTDDAPFSLPSAGAQRVEPLPVNATDSEEAAGDEDHASRLWRVTVRAEGTSPATEAERRDARYLAANMLIDHEDPEIIAFTERGLRGVKPDDAAEAAEALRRAVHRHIVKKDLVSAFASASETIRSGAGDCSEHAVLLAAALRAGGIPSRLAIGLMYVDRFGDERHLFGWHMWTQALVKDHWVDLDATTFAPFHPGRLLIAVTSMHDDEQGRGFGEAVALMGRLAIDVVEVQR